MPKTVLCESREIEVWSGFEGAIRELSCEQEKRANEHGPQLPELLFRGLGNSEWGLETTLERSYPLERCDDTSSLRTYYQKTRTAKPAIETLGGRRFETVPTVPEFNQLLSDNASLWLEIVLFEKPQIYEYFVYLRHHGFPSPLLDWTASPYVAAFFAFDSPPKEAKSVCVCALSRDSGSSGSSDAHMWVIGQYMVSHPRHLLQQCQYSMCVAMDPANRDYIFRPQESGLAGAVGPKGALSRIIIPATERATALRQLDLMNINAFSLFGSEDSLVRTVARRELLFRDWS
jgi:hypothetical protein